jgi:hypothetical protein
MQKNCRLEPLYFSEASAPDGASSVRSTIDGCKKLTESIYSKILLIDLSFFTCRREALCLVLYPIIPQPHRKKKASETSFILPGGSTNSCPNR